MIKDEKYVIAGSLHEKDWKKISVFDLDGVLVDVSERLKATLEELGQDPKEVLKNGTIDWYKLPSDKNFRRIFWSIFLSPKYMYLDKPREVGIRLLKEAKKKGRSIVLLSGRRENMLNETIKQLSDFGIEWNMLVHRAEGNFSKDYAFKYEFIRDRLGGKIYEFHDDSSSCCVAIRDGGRFVEKVKGIAYEFIPEICAFKICRHIGPTWYNLVSNSLWFKWNNKDDLFHILDVYNTDPISGKVILKDLAINYPLTVKWMWIEETAKTQKDLIKILKEIDKSIKWLEDFGKGIEVALGIPSEEIHDNIENVDLAVFKDDSGEEWHIPILVPHYIFKAYLMANLT